MPITSMVRPIRTMATTLLYIFRAMGEKLSPAFLNRITATAQKNAHARAKADPINSFSCFTLY
jgi:hypothetical protein